MQLSESFYKINALTQEQRDAAYNAVRERIAGRKPVYADYERNTHQRFPRWVNAVVTVLCLGMLVAAFLPSAMRLHAIALATNAPVIVDTASTYVAALSIVLMAEIGQVVFSLASATTEKRSYALALGFGSLVGLAIAICGNAVAMGDHALESSVAFLETYAPPVLVLITANILKAQMLNAVAERHAAHKQFVSALAAWEKAVADADTHPAWQRTLANALRDALRTANKRSSAILREVTDSDWLALIERERNAEEWYERESERQTQTSGRSSSQSTGDIAAAVTTQEGGIYVKHCPICEMRFEGKSPRSATNAVVAHQKTHRKEEAKAIAGTLPNADAPERIYANGNGVEQ